MILLVRHIKRDTITGYVKDREQFLVWLRNHNIQRIREKEISEYQDEFSLTEVEELQ